MIDIKIIVCIKQVPGTTEIKINPETNTLVREGVETVINPFDTYAIEEGIRLKEKLAPIFSQTGEEIETIALTMGPPQSNEMLKEVISLGIDKAVLLSDRAFAGADTWATALTLAEAIKKFNDWKLIILGKQTLDGDTGQVGPELAHKLNIPFIGYASSILDIDKNRMTIKRLMEDRYETFEIKLPAAISVGKDINIPRVPSLRGKLRAKNEVIPVWDKNYLNIDKSQVGLEGSYTQVIRIFMPEHHYDVKMFEGSPDQQVDEIYGKLKELNIV
ncbi:MAG: electron transfer flavoprotein subunit beta/FixA family protein [Actinobacteria bacterium]|nr:electron transfer flavoprotein subunit beta/FixA family protein [Actinomycetota bacterium]MCL5069455.1 electron transfer flavoprotein subunit beta/FixA family protein [Actinomycetota bacterium]